MYATRSVAHFVTSERWSDVATQGLSALVPPFDKIASAIHDQPNVVSEHEESFFYALCDGTIVLSVVVILILAFVTAPYGRHTGLSFLFGPSIPGRLAWMLQELPSFLIPIIIVATAADYHYLSYTGNQILLGMFLLHYFNRSIIYPLQIRDPKPTPIGVWFLAFLWCSVNGYTQGRWFSNFRIYNDNWVTNPQFIVGVALYLFGFLSNIQSDSILRNLRKEHTTGYFIPKGGLFEYVSAANYLAETIEWLGFMIAADFAYPAVSFFIFVVANLAPRAVSNHRWYQEKFKGEYPANRKAFIPFIF